MTVRGVLRALRHPISQNAAALAWVQVATFVVPLVTLPYLSRVLGETAFGLVVFAQATSFLLGLVVDFGFAGSATRAVAASRGDRGALERVVADVVGAKALMAGASLLIALVVLLLVPVYDEHAELLWLAWGAAVAQGLTPGWYFVGIERAIPTAVVQLTARALTAALTFVLVQNAGDAWIVLALYLAGSVFAMVVLNALLLRRVRLRLPRLTGVRAAAREASVLFVGGSALSLYTSANVVVLGLFVPAAQVAHFGAAEKVVRALQQVMGAVATAVFPRLAYLHAQGERAQARRLLLLALAVLGGGALVAAAVLVVLAPTVVRIVFGPGYEEAVTVLRVLAVLLPLSALAGTLAGGWMLALRMDAATVRAMVLAAAVNLGLAVVLAPLFGPVGMALALVACEVAAVTACVLAIRREEAGADVRLLPSLFAPRAAVAGLTRGGR